MGHNTPPPGSRQRYNANDLKIWTTKRLPIHTDDKGELYAPFRGPRSIDYKIYIDKVTGRAVIPEGIPSNQGIVITVKVGNNEPVVNHVP